MVNLRSIKASRRRLFVQLGRLSTHKTDIEARSGEIHAVREDGGETPARDAEPVGKRRSILIDRRSRNERSAGISIVLAAKRERRERSIHRTAVNAGSDDEMMIAPRVVAAVVSVGT